MERRIDEDYRLLVLVLSIIFCNEKKETNRKQTSHSH